MLMILSEWFFFFLFGPVSVPSVPVVSVKLGRDWKGVRLGRREDGC
jgi:hypothetical protein